MKIIHSYWSKPYNNLGGWSYPIFHYMGMALSCLKYSEFYDVELVTDKAGKKLLIDTLKLPYSSVKVELDHLNDYSTDLWAIGKLYAYGMQNEPFIHVDNDTFIWAPFPEKIEKAGLIAQHEETDSFYNDDFFEEVENNGFYIPEIIHTHRMKEKKVKEINAGILGGNDIEFIQEYVKLAFDFVEKNKNDIHKLGDKGLFNTVFEQYLFYCMAAVKNKPIAYLVDNVDKNFSGLGDVSEVPVNKTFIHAVGPLKRNYFIGEQITHRLWFEYPEYYDLIVDLFKTNKL